MDGVLWYVLSSSRQSDTRVRIVEHLDDQPLNANELSEALGLEYSTVRHHLEILEENDILQKSDEEYGADYLLTDQVREDWDTVEEIIDTVDPDD